MIKFEIKAEEKETQILWGLLKFRKRINHTTSIDKSIKKGKNLEKDKLKIIKILSNFLTPLLIKQVFENLKQAMFTIINWMHNL
jgi:hypothetical protein